MEKVFQPYHLVSVSPWPLFVGVGSLFMVLGVAQVMLIGNYELLKVSMMGVVMVMLLWWRDVIREGTFQGCHVSLVVKGLMVGMILFIISEVFFFLSFFWTFFHSSLSPTLELGSEWPPVGVIPFNPFQVPLLNTVILLSSGVSVTWAHQSILGGNLKDMWWSLMVTWVLGVYFLGLQGFEYWSAMFGISDSVFGSVFFMATGFHGFHVVVGFLFLFVMWVRGWKVHFFENHHFGFEAAAWYWHFVDVVWLFLFSVVYWWGG
uniref:Cytochrome c oxidase subunit 3 n=1 Tax=Phyxioschema suthepium TaxID=1155482 RepID=L7NWG4_9ARAC|nr:cytochrome c oxidase subunit III [Phyxioschema suthepium]AFC77861.1 cytochrome c oxidase subunit III [Phyxioschema suthepium]